ncbi:hypothetical protein ABZ615_36980, partial [Streptomyces sp. NPDC007325]
MPTTEPQSAFPPPATTPTPPAVPVPGDPGWEELVSAALLGTDRRPSAGRRGDEAAGALLDAAARRTLRRRAGRRPGPAAVPP